MQRASRAPSFSRNVNATQGAALARHENIAKVGIVL